MSNLNSDMLNLLKNDAHALRGLFNVIEYLGPEKFFKIYHDKDRKNVVKDNDKKNEKSDFETYANDLFDQINNYLD